MLEVTRRVILTVFLKTVISENIIINIRYEETSLAFYKHIIAEQNIFKQLMDNLFKGSSSTFSINNCLEAAPHVAKRIQFLKTENDSTFFKCWNQQNIDRVTCERQTMNQCKLTFSNESCCSIRNAFLWNTSLEFLYSTKIRNFTVKCGNQTNKKILFVYKLVQTPSSSTTLRITSTMKHSKEADNSTGLIIGITVAVILVAVLAIIGFIVWKKRKQIKNSNSKSALNAASPGNYENTSQRNVPNLYNLHTNINVLPVNINKGRPISPKPQIDLNDNKLGNTDSSYSNTEYTDHVDDNYTRLVYDVPNPPYSTNDQNFDKIEYYSSNEEVVQPQIDDYTTIDSPDVCDKTNTGRSDELIVDYSTIDYAVGQQENSQNDNITVREPCEVANVAKNPHSVLGNNDKNITDPYNVLPPEPEMTSAYFILLSEGELPQYSMAQNVSSDDGDNVKNEATTIEQ